MTESNNANKNALKEHNKKNTSESWMMSKIQSILAITLFIWGIISLIVFALVTSNIVISFNSFDIIKDIFLKGGILLIFMAIVAIGIEIASFVFAILQIIKGVHENNMLSWIAGTLILCGIIPFMGFVALIAGVVMSMIVWSKGPNQ